MIQYRCDKGYCVAIEGGGGHLTAGTDFFVCFFVFRSSPQNPQNQREKYF